MGTVDRRIAEGRGKRSGPHTLNKLTATAVSKAKGRGYRADGGGLFLQVSASGGKSWVFRFRLNGKLREMGLGPLHAVTLADAREKAAERRKELVAFRLGESTLDPLERRRAARQRANLDAARAMTFRKCAEAYIAAHKAVWRSPKSLKAWESTLTTEVYPIFGGIPVQAIDTALVMQVLEPIWTVKPETASRVRGRIEIVIDYAKAREWRAAGENPARWRGHLDKMLATPTKAKQAARRTTGRDEHHAALSYGEIAGFLDGLRRQAGVAARALEFAILTAPAPARSSAPAGRNST